MEILVTGGNGFLGRHLVPRLLEGGHRVRVLALEAEETSWLEARGVLVHRGDIRRAESLSLPMRRVEAVIHLAAMQDVWRPLADYRAVNVSGTANVCREALAAGVQRLVHVSSSSVYGLGGGAALTEASPLVAFPDPYAITKAEADRLVQRMIREEELPAVIIRPAQIFGPGDGVHFAQMAERLRAGRGLMVGSGRNRVPFVYVTDAVQVLLLALENQQAVGGAFNLAHDHPLTQAEMLRAIAEQIGAPPPRLHVPFSALYAAGWAAERVALLRGAGRRPPLTRFGVAFLGADTRLSIEAARSRLGFRPEVPLREGVRLAAAWYLRRQPLPDGARAAPGQAR
ncbi:MAG: NAD-dependent epimerase/dehydratase family protein [Candidatus Dormiibacterota bacterium]